MNIRFNLCALGLLTLAFAGCEIGGVRGNGHVVTEKRDVGPFSDIEVSGAYQVEWSKGPPSLTLQTDRNLLQYIEINVRDGTLHVRSTRSLRPSKSMKLTLTSDSVAAASLSGASRLTVHQLDVPRFSLETSGASKIVIDGRANELVASMTGASDLRAEQFRVQRAELAVTGAGDAYVNVSDTLKASITGAGKVEYAGNPAHIERQITGAGAIRHRQ